MKLTATISISIQVLIGIMGFLAIIAALYLSTVDVDKAAYLVNVALKNTVITVLTAAAVVCSIIFYKKKRYLPPVFITLIVITGFIASHYPLHK